MSLVAEKMYLEEKNRTDKELEQQIASETSWYQVLERHVVSGGIGVHDIFDSSHERGKQRTQLLKAQAAEDIFASSYVSR